MDLADFAYLLFISVVLLTFSVIINKPLLFSKIENQHVPLRQVTEEKVRGKGQEEVWVDENG